MKNIPVGKGVFSVFGHRYFCIFHGTIFFYTVIVFYYVIVCRVIKRIAMDVSGGLKTDS